MDAFRFHAFVLTLAFSAARLSHQPSTVSTPPPTSLGEKIDRGAGPLPLGIKDVVAKSTGTSNPHNMLKATLNAFKMSESPKSVAAKRSKKVTEIITNKN